MPETQEPRKIPIIVGPTGVGKSEVAFHLAQSLGAGIVSADAFQVFRGLEVGTAQPSREMQAQVPHHLIGVRDPQEPWNAVEFAKQASHLLEGPGRFLLVGGAGFYLRALVEGPPEGGTADPEVRRMVLERARDLGNQGAWDWLQERDPSSAKRLHPNDLKRICRALEKTFLAKEAPVLEYRPLGKDRVLFLGLERSRDKLDGLLRERTRKMWREGILDETRRLVQMALPTDHPVWGAIGYLEAASFLRGEMDEPAAMERIFRRTRQYAKRQWTWFRHQAHVQWFDLDLFPSSRAAADHLEEYLKHPPL